MKTDTLSHISHISNILYVSLVKYNVLVLLWQYPPAFDVINKCGFASLLVFIYYDLSYLHFFLPTP